MISLAARRHPGLAMRPALFLFALLTPLLLLAGCRQQGEWHIFEGVALGSGYHITLNGDLGEGESALVEAAIQGELASLDNDIQLLQHLLAAGWPMVLGPPGAQVPDDLLQLYRARAVDHLAHVLGEFGVEHALVELGGVQRTLGRAGRHPWRVRLPRTGLASAPDAALRLEGAALVTRSAARRPEADAPGEARVLAVSVVAQSAEAADHLARELLDSPLEAAMEQPARVVVLTPRGITLHIGAGLEPLLER
ncbi:FAD:protein FMN transferase [Halomonas mongoliensis]|uniref:FAD:protein FMN transferase n=1 Tax=Halomonas mongoliensis TaxID=321265 RepID=UPI00403ADC31